MHNGLQWSGMKKGRTFQMEIVCPACGKVYQVRDEQLSGPAIKARCKACGNVFSIQKGFSQNQNREGGSTPRASHESESGERRAPEPPEPPLSEESSDTEDPGGPVDVDHHEPGDHLESPNPSMEQGRKDYIPIVVLLAAIAALVIVSFLGIKNIDSDSFFRPLRSISQVTDFFQGMGARSARRAHLKKERKNVGYQRHLSQGHLYFRTKKYNAALKEYNLAIRADSGRYEAYYWRGQLLGLRKEYQKAIEDMRQVLRLNPSYTKAHRSLGWAYYETGKYDEAIQALDRYINANAKDGWAFYERALAYHKKGDVPTALKNAKKACDLGFKRGCDVYKRYQ